MRLTAQNLVHYLRGRDLLSAASVVDGDWLVVEASSRHRNFKVLRPAPGLFVKQADAHDPLALATLAREAACYHLAADEPDFAALTTVMPGLRLHDPASGVLVLDLLPQSENLLEYHHRLHAFPPEIGARLGQALGAYHSVSPSAAGAATQPFPRALPWVLTTPHLASSLAGASGGGAQLMGIVRQFPDFQRHLDALRASWQADSLIHGDMKWENCLVSEGGGPLRVVDWEMADLGDPAWDVGGVLQSYLTCWITSLPLDAGHSPAMVMHLARHPIEAMQPALRAFWSAYAATRGLRGGAAADHLDRSVGAAAARMIQTAYEHLYAAPQVSAHTLCLLQVSLNMLGDPQAALRDLLELEAVA